MQKIKLSETEKEEVARIKTSFMKTFEDNTDFQFAVDVGYLFSLIDRITE